MKKFFLVFIILLSTQFALAENVVILHTSDVHGRIAPIEYKNDKNIGGFSRRVTFINNVKLSNKNVWVFDSGDYFQGSLYYRIYKGKISAKLIQYANYDAITIGNHEFDDGITVLKNIVKRSKTQFICSNLKFEDKYLQKHVKPYIVKEVDGKKILIIGVTTSHLNDLSKGQGFLIENPADTVKYIISTVPADKIIIISHCGLEEDRLIAHKNPKIDLILGGHNHYFFQTPETLGNTKIIHDGEFGVGVGIINFDTIKGVVNYSRQRIDSRIESNRKIDRKIYNTDKKLAKYKELVVAKTNITLLGEQTFIEHNQTNLGRLVLKSMVLPFSSYDAVLVQAGSIRVNRNISKKITYADILEILPFDGYIVECELSGKDLKSVIKKGQKYGRRYLQYYSKIDNLEDDKMYKVITTDYIASSKDGFTEFTNVKLLSTVNINPYKLLEKFLNTEGTITIKSLEMP